MLESASCCVVPVEDSCPTCNTPWSKTPHAFYDVNASICNECGTHPSRYRLRLNIYGRQQEFRYTHKGLPLRNVDIAVTAAFQIRAAVADGTFTRANHQRSVIYDTLSEFITGHIVKTFKFTEEEREFLEDFMAPFFCEVGVFAACMVHLHDFIRTFGLKGERLDMAKRLFEVVTSEIKI